MRMKSDTVPNGAAQSVPTVGIIFIISFPESFQISEARETRNACEMQPGGGQGQRQLLPGLFKW